MQPLYDGQDLRDYVIGQTRPTEITCVWLSRFRFIFPSVSFNNSWSLSSITGLRLNTSRLPKRKFLSFRVMGGGCEGEIRGRRPLCLLLLLIYHLKHLIPPGLPWLKERGKENEVVLLFRTLPSRQANQCQRLPWVSCLFSCSTSPPASNTPSDLIPDGLLLATFEGTIIVVGSRTSFLWLLA